VELLGFQEVEKTQDSLQDPLSKRLSDLVSQALKTNQALIQYLDDVSARAAPRFSLSTVNFFKSSLGMSIFLIQIDEGIKKIKDQEATSATNLERQLVVANRQALSMISSILIQVYYRQYNMPVREG
jgi:hypothetical protein